MLKKFFAVALLAMLSIFAVPAVANAAGYGGTGEGDNGSTIVVAPGAPATFDFAGFTPGEATTASAPDAVTLATVKVISSASKPAAADGSVSYTATATQPGSYTITVSSATNVASATFVVAPADSGSGSGSGSNADGSLPNTGLETPMLIVWGAAGALALGVALVFVLNVVRRNKQSV